MDVTAESVIAVYEDRARIGGLRMVYEPGSLRFFQARFEPLAAVPSGRLADRHAAGAAEG
ncbi:Tyrosine phenol-lyase [compost metagenome]